MKSIGLLLRAAIMLLVLVAAPTAAILGKPSWRRTAETTAKRLWSELESRLPQLDGAGDQPGEGNEEQAAILSAVELGAAESLDAAPPLETTAPNETVTFPDPHFDAGEETDDLSRHAAVSPPTPAPGGMIANPFVAANQTPLSRAERSQQLQSRLQSHGAKYYLLEAQAGSPRQYRFYCEVDSPAGPERYESTQGDELRAMEEVLMQIETRLAQTRSGAARR